VSTIERRLRKLEDRFHTVETDFNRRLRERIAAGQRRLRDAEEKGLCKPPERGPWREFTRQRLLNAVRHLNW